MGWIVKKSSSNIFEVHTAKGKVEVVDIDFQTCSCNMWRINNFPCDHAIRAILSQNLVVYDYIEDYFKTSYYILTYSHNINPVPSLQSLNEAPETIMLYPPDYKRLPGRPSTRRRTNIAERVSRIKRKCALCQSTGHNKRTCQQYKV